MLIVTNWTARMPPHMVRVFRYQSGKSPLFHAMKKLSNLNGPDGVSEAISLGIPGRNDATAIQANGTAHSKAAALTPSSRMRRHSAFIMYAALERAERDQRQRQQCGDADHRRRRGEPKIVILRCLLIDVIEQEVS